MPENPEYITQKQACGDYFRDCPAVAMQCLDCEYPKTGVYSGDKETEDAEEQAECSGSEYQRACKACRKSYLDGYWTGRQDGVWQEVEAKAKAKPRKSRKDWRKEAKWQTARLKITQACLTDRDAELQNAKELLAKRDGELLDMTSKQEASYDAAKLHEARVKADANILKLRATHRICENWVHGTPKRIYPWSAMEEICKVLGIVDDE